MKKHADFNLPGILYQMDLYVCESCGEWSYRTIRKDTEAFVDDGVCNKCGGTHWIMLDVQIFGVTAKSFRRDGIEVDEEGGSLETKRRLVSIQNIQQQIERNRIAYERHEKLLKVLLLELQNFKPM